MESGCQVGTRRVTGEWQAYTLKYFPEGKDMDRNIKLIYPYKALLSLKNTLKLIEK